MSSESLPLTNFDYHSYIRPISGLRITSVTDDLGNNPKFIPYSCKVAKNPASGKPVRLVETYIIRKARDSTLLDAAVYLNCRENQPGEFAVDN